MGNYATLIDYVPLAITQSIPFNYHLKLIKSLATLKRHIYEGYRFEEYVEILVRNSYNNFFISNTESLAAVSPCLIHSWAR